MRPFWICLTILGLILSACQNAPAAPAVPTPGSPAFPTMTPGRQIRMPLPTPAPRESGGLGNPATALALANRPTATPDYALCPPVDSTVELPAAAPESAFAVEETLTEFLSNGGSPQEVERALAERWALLGPNGTVRADLDLSGEGVPELLISYIAPGEGGAMLVFVCRDGRYSPRYSAITGGTAPEILNIGDMNYDGRAEITYTSLICGVQSEDDAATGGADACRYATQIITWNAERGRLINLVSGEILSENPPEIQDFDQDRVNELIVRLENDGDARTGPLRTGFTVYDWNGVVYTRSITQLDPPRFLVQVIHAADLTLASGNTLEARSLFELALNDTSLENWHNNDRTVLPTYAQYRLLLIYADTEDPRLIELHGQLLTEYPDPAAAPVYIELALGFFEALQSSNNLHTACLRVLDLINARPEALSLLNRYGSSSPTYTATDLCPY